MVLGGADKPSRPHRKGGSHMLLLDPAFPRNLGPSMSPRVPVGAGHTGWALPRSRHLPSSSRAWGGAGAILQGPQGNPGSAARGAGGVREARGLQASDARGSGGPGVHRVHARREGL